MRARVTTCINTRTRPRALDKTLRKSFEERARHWARVREVASAVRGLRVTEKRVFSAGVTASAADATRDSSALRAPPLSSAQKPR